MTERNKLYATDVIGEDYKKWYREVILLGFGTGRGKTTFSLNTYCHYLISQEKTILYLCNRSKLKEQIEEKVNNSDLKDKVEILTYQKLQELLKSGDTIPTFDVYICDEAHFFLADSEFNLYTDVSYEYLISQKDSVVIFMTATYQNIFPRIKKDLCDLCKKTENEYIEPKEYILPTLYDYVEKICWFKKPSEIYGIIDTILRTTEDEKILYFCNSISMMTKFYNHYSPYKGGSNSEEKEEYLQKSNLRYMDFYCSEYSSNKFAKEHSNNDAIIQGEDNGYTFQNKVLISTKCIDNGIDFKDQKIKHIICDIFDLESAIQCLGRKRILNENDTCIFYIRDWQYWSVRAFLTNIKKEIEPVDLYESDYEKFIEKYGSDRNFKNNVMYFHYDKDKKGIVDVYINHMKYDKLKQDIQLVQEILNQEIAYRDLILKFLGESAFYISEDVENTIQDKTKDAIEIFLEIHQGQKLDKSQQNELVDICNIKDNWGRKLTSYNSLNTYFDAFNYPYIIESKRLRENGTRQYFWFIHNIKSLSQKTQKLIDTGIAENGTPDKQHNPRPPT